MENTIKYTQQVDNYYNVEVNIWSDNEGKLLYIAQIPWKVSGKNHPAISGCFAKGIELEKAKEEIKEILENQHFERFAEDIKDKLFCERFGVIKEGEFWTIKTGRGGIMYTGRRGVLMYLNAIFQSMEKPVDNDIVSFPLAPEKTHTDYRDGNGY